MKDSSSNRPMQSIYTKPLSRLNVLGRRRTKNPSLDYLRALFAGRNLDLVVAMAAPAARFGNRARFSTVDATTHYRN